MDISATQDQQAQPKQAKNKKTKQSQASNNQASSDSIPEDILKYYSRVRHDSEYLCQPLEIEDYGIQTMPEVSPPKWHLAHTSWFFETLLLKPFNGGYLEYDPKYAILFNSYYDTIGNYHPRDQRGLLSRPTVNEVYQYRAYVDNAMHELLSQKNHSQRQEIISRTILGLNHEQQHQELLLTDIKHIFASNPLQPTYKQHLQNHDSKSKDNKQNTKQSKINWIEFDGGIKSIGVTHNVYAEETSTYQNFSYDNEGPKHKVLLQNFMLASKPVTNGEYLKFIAAGGYQQVELWLSDAWQIVKGQNWQAPLYWKKINNDWFYMTLCGMQKVDLNAPVSHISFYEAAAYARWVNLTQPGVRLPTEAEWEFAASSLPIEGNFRETGILQPQSSRDDANEDNLQQMFGDVWEWTQSAYAAYPGYHAAIGPLGEYNGKFMSSQMVLRGGSCISPTDHLRTTYRNFFYPHERWQFSGFRLAKDF